MLKQNLPKSKSIDWIRSDCYSGQLTVNHLGSQNIVKDKKKKKKTYIQQTCYLTIEDIYSMLLFQQIYYSSFNTSQNAWNVSTYPKNMVRWD